MVMKEQILVVTGGGSGIGRAVVEAAAVRGMTVAVLDAARDAAAEVAAGALQTGRGSVVGIECDVREEEQVAAAFARVVKDLGPPAGLFAAAGIDIGGRVHEMDYAQWRRVQSTNVDGTFLSCKYALRVMLGTGERGAIVCCSSPSSFVAFAAGGASAYSASKGAVSALVRCLAIDYAPYGIRVNAVVPGATETPLMWANVPTSEQPAMRAQLATEIPLRRMASPAEPAQAVLWLLSEDAAYVTGSHLVCDGGILAKGSISV